MSLHTKSETLFSARATGVAWAASGRQSCETQMDSETSVSLRCHLFEDFANAQSWAELIDNLAAKDFHLIFQTGRLVLVNAFTGVDLCTCRNLGFSFAALAENLGKPCVMADTGRVVVPPARQ